VEMVELAVLDCRLRATSKKGRQIFSGKKCTPRQNPGYAYALKHAGRGERSLQSSWRQRLRFISYSGQ